MSYHSKLIFTILFSLNMLMASALDLMNSYEVTALYKSNLVVTAKIIPGKERLFTIEINNILKMTEGINLVKGNEIKVMVPEFGSFGTERRVYESEYVLYLTFNEDLWTLTYGEEHTNVVEDGLIPFDICDRTYNLNTKQFKQMNHDLFMCFKYENDYRYTPVLTPAQYQKKKNPLAVVFQFYRCYSNLNSADQYMDESEFLGPDFVHVDTTIHDFCETDPGFTLSPNEFMDYLDSNIPEEISNNEKGIEGNIYIKFVIEPDSTGSQFQVVRGIDSELDAFAVELVKGLTPFVPGTIRGIAVRSYYILPIRIRKK